jgi:phospholipid/cholesterol/gamma-HCH transport system substrate-binding protein
MATKFGTEARLGLFVILGFLAFIWGTTQLTHLGEDGGYELTAVFKNASGLDVNAPVRMVGVTIGRVKSIGIVERRALVTLLIQDGYRIDKDATLSIRSQGILGDKVVEIIPGKAKEYLGAGDEVKNTKAAVDLDSLMESLQSAGDDLSVILSSFRKIVGTEEGEQNMKDILHNTKNLSANLNSLVTNNRERVDSILTNFDQLIAKLDGMAGENREDIRELIANIKEVSENLKKTIPDLTAKLESAAEQVTGVLSENRDGVRDTVDQIKRDAELLEGTLASLKKITKRIEDGEGTLGKLINEDEPYNNLNETLAGVNKMIRRADRLRVNLDVHGNYLSALEGVKGYITIDLQPTPEKFYRLELIDDPEGL